MSYIPNAEMKSVTLICNIGRRGTEKCFDKVREKIHALKLNTVVNASYQNIKVISSHIKINDAKIRTYPLRHDKQNEALI